MSTLEPAWQRDQPANTNHVIGDPLAAIYNEDSWRLNKVSPLHNLQYTAVKLKQYAAKIRQALVCAVTVNSTTKYTVLFKVVPNLKYSEDDPDGLMITVESTQEKNNKPKVAYASILLSWGVNSPLNNETHLPYLLERGEKKFGAAVKTTLQMLFDCNIRQLTFTPHQLLAFGFNFVESDTSRHNDQFTLSYKTPQVDHKDKLNLSFAVGDVHIIWNGIKEEATRRSDLVKLAYQILQNQIFYMLMLDITAFDLCEVLLPKAEVKNNGVVKMKTPEAVNCVLTLLNELNDI